MKNLIPLVLLGLALTACGDKNLEWYAGSYDNSTRCSTQIVSAAMQRVQVASENLITATKQLTYTNHWYFVNGDSQRVTDPNTKLEYVYKNYDSAKKEYQAALVAVGYCYDIT